MSQTWVIKDTAPVGIYWISLTDVNFTSNGQNFTRIDTLNMERYDAVTKITTTRYTLRYYTSESSQISVTSSPIITENNVPTGNVWEFTNEAYRTITFETPPTGDLLLWLLNNAKMAGNYGLPYQDIHLEDKALWNQLQTAWEQGDYTAALNVLKNASLNDKQLNAATINALTTELLSLQAQSDPSFKTGKIVVASEPPSDLAVGKVYFRLIGPVGDYNEQNAYYIEINQKTSSGYDVLNPETQADNIALTENTAAKFGLVGVTYTLDKALYDVEQLLQVVTTT